MVRRKSRRAKSNSSVTNSTHSRSTAYRQLTHPFDQQRVFSEDAVTDMHHTALKLLEELGIKILLPEARKIFKQAGATVFENTSMVHVGREIVDAALSSAPKSIRLRAASPEREQTYQQGSLLFTAGSGCPNVYDMERGRRPGSLQDFTETIKLQHSIDVIHLLSPSAEPQDIAPELRHYAMMQTQMLLSDKPLFIYARGHQQVTESLELITLALDLDESEFTDGAWATTIINSNSPRQLDIPMAEGIIDFAKAGQLSVITPFCLAGAMAPITIAGALILQHAEALAGISLAQLVRPGAPVSYGGFASNVDMKSGSPAFGTPEHVKLTIGTGQLARHIGLPWRTAAGSAANIADMQSATENNMGLWAAMQANATLVLHAAGWLEGGLCFGYEKFINDIEALQSLAELCIATPEDDDSFGWPALADVAPGGHFFATEHTMARYRDAFYSPFIADLSNYGTWQDAGKQSSTERAVRKWKEIIQAHQAPEHTELVKERTDPYIQKRSASGGAPPS